MYRLLEEWMEDKGKLLMDSYGGGVGVTVDVWTDVRPHSRKEYMPQLLDEAIADDEEDEGGGRKSRSKKDRGGSQNKKGRQHPNAKNKNEKQQSAVSKNSQKEEHKYLCSQEFYFGREKCPGVYMKQKRGGGRGRSNSIGDDEASCQLCHYHQFPKVKSAKSSWVVSNGMPQTPPLTLAQVINGKYAPHKILKEEKPVALPVHVREAILSWAYDAAAMNGVDADVTDGAKEKVFDLMYHSRIYVQSELSDEENDEIKQDNNSSASDGDSEDSRSDDDSEDDFDNFQVLQTLQQLFDDEKLAPINVVYVSIQGILIYDANRGGILHSDATESYLLYGEAFDADFGKPVEEMDDGGKCLHEQLTHHILDEILSFLDDESAGVLPQVCRTWRDEVGTRSPQLWRMLLNRRNWLSTVNVGDATANEGVDTNDCELYKRAFISHYLAVRDVQAITNACTFLQSGNSAGGRNTKQKDGIEYAVQSFKATKSAPIFGNTDDRGRCTVKVWPSVKNPRALAAYAGDCTLRLFEAVQGSSSARMICRQIVCVRASPPSISRKRNNCELIAMDFDDDVVASLVNEHNALAVDSTGDEVELIITPWITVIPCEELVCAGNEGILGEECVHSFNVRSIIIDYILAGSEDEQVTDLREEVVRFLSVVDGGTSEILINVRPQLVACGKGHYLFHASISIPGYSLMPDSDHEDFENFFDFNRERASTFVFPSSVDMLFVVSTQRGGSIIHSRKMMEGCNALFASSPFRHQLDENEPAALCTYVVTHGLDVLKLRRITLRRDGTLDSITLRELPQVDRNVCVHVTPSHVLYGARQQDSVIRVFDIKSRTIWRTPIVGDVSLWTPRLGDFPLLNPLVGGVSLLNIQLIHRDYAIAISSRRSDEDEEDDEAFEFDGHWFGPDGTSFDVHVYHLPSRHCIHECTIPNLHLSLDTKDDVIAMNASTLGFVIAGASAREVARKAEDDERANEESLLSPNSKNPKGKKKRLASKLAKKDKKDGFARGMSMRG